MPDDSTTTLTTAAVESFRRMRSGAGRLDAYIALGILTVAHIHNTPDVLHAVVTAVLAEIDAETERAVAEIEAMRAERRTFVTANLEVQA